MINATSLNRLSIHCIPDPRLFNFNMSNPSQLLELELHFSDKKQGDFQPPSDTHEDPFLPFKFSKLKSITFHAHGKLNLISSHIKFHRYCPSIRKLVLTSGHYFTHWASFMNFLGPILMRNLESISLQGIHVARYTSCLNCSLTSLPARTYTFDKVRSLELHRIDPGGFQGCFFPRLRKLVLSHLLGVVSDRLTEVVRAAGQELESLSISTRFGRESQSSIREDPVCQVYDSRMEGELFRRMKLKRFSSVGHYCFSRTDWEALCTRAFPYYHFVHVEQPLVDEFDVANHGRRAIYLNSKNEVQPHGLRSIHGGRAFISADDTRRWSFSDGDASSTLRLFDGFLADADPECDLVISRGMIVNRYAHSPEGGVRVHRPFCTTDLSKSAIAAWLPER